MTTFETGFARVNDAQIHFEQAGAGHIANMEAPDQFKKTVLHFLMGNSRLSQA
jgi:hypothetical protein